MMVTNYCAFRSQSSEWTGRWILGAVWIAMAMVLGAFPCGGPIDWIGLRATREGDTFVMRWSAESGATRVVWSANPHDPGSWRPVAGQGWDGVPANWQAAVRMDQPRAFFKLVADAPPRVAPSEVRVLVVDGHLRLEWSGAGDATGYVVSVGAGAMGPVRRITVPVGNVLELEGLEDGRWYTLSVAAVNPAGVGPDSAAVRARSGPQALVCGDVVLAHGGAAGRFEVSAAGATVILTGLGGDGGRFAGNADERGHFRISGVPPGVYQVDYFWQGIKGALPEALQLKGGAVLGPLPLAVADGEGLCGTVVLADGSAARCSLPEFKMDERSLLTAVLADGSRREFTPDGRGRWSLAGLGALDYPLTLKATFLNETVSLEVRRPPSASAPIELRFTAKAPQEVRVRAFQDGREVTDLLPGVPVTFLAEVGDAGAVKLEPLWVAECNGNRVLATGNSFTHVFEQPVGPPQGATGGLGDPQDSGMVTVRVVPSLLEGTRVRLFEFHLIDWIKKAGCWSGTVTTWNPHSPQATAAGHPASVRLDHAGILPPSPTLATTTATSGGYFEMGIDPVNRAPYLLRIDKEDHMRFLWPYEFQLPEEGQYPVVPANVHAVSQGSEGIVIPHSSGGQVSFPAGSLYTTNFTVWNGDIVVRMVSFDPRQTNPLPPNPILQNGSTRRGIAPYGAFWLDVRTDGGLPLIPSTGATLRLRSSVTPSNPATMSTYLQSETTGYFEPWSTATRVGTNLYEIPLGRAGLFLIGNDQPLVELVFETDRSLNYPFDVLIGGWNSSGSVATDGYSLHPVTVQGPCRNNYGKLYVAHNSALRMGVIDLRHAPGRHHAVISPVSAAVDPVNKPLIIRKVVVPSTTPSTPPAVAGHWVRFSLADTEPALKSHPADTTVNAITGADHFLSRGGVNSASEAAQYYAKIKAPATLSAWRAANGLPTRFGDPLPGVAATDYATAYYYNLGDLGFARAQTMRVRESSYDCQPDVAFAVTNYESLEDARCGRGPVATVCMDHSARVDQGEFVPKRYTRFYVYGSNGQLLQEANLDGAGLKAVPNLCVICHGGDFYSGGGTTNLGSKFLPFDLESYSFHPKFGIQHQELAAMNAAVLKTSPTAAIKDLIHGWYGTTNPNLNPTAFNQTHVPSAPALSWSADPALYSHVFKPSCRICHISRNSGSSVQFDSYGALQSYGFGKYSANTSLQMPHAQRTWGGYWGSRCSSLLAFLVNDMPTLLDNAGP